ncbi:3-dehydroquinate synthase [Alicyclobacillus sacchari]|uniref:3-dehydroquinate synthase n=1 Tax=Alicyclobacillus sacchari TaxID=392010 RepID=UPI0024E09BE8|nr:3-dehydroquinate synthase [Alicyclobacillus sacchari]
MSQLPWALSEAGLDERRIAVITDDTVRQQPIAQELAHVLEQSSYDYSFVVIPAGDAHKSLDTAVYVYGELLTMGFRRGDVIVALGGGVVGDLAGFVAATYMRGVPFIQVPTTLLAHDSALGGKVGVNLPQGKNLVGAFYPPKTVVFDTRALLSLPERQWVNGMAEVIKHALIGDANLFAALEAQPLRECPDPTFLEPILADAMQVKVNVVNADEHEAGLRQVLNVGHTIGHAIEQCSHYELGHGEAIAIGLVLEADLAVMRGMLTMEARDRLVQLLRAHGLPIRPQERDFAEIAKRIQVDKKHGRRGWTFALPQAIGRVEVVTDIEEDEVRRVYERAFEGRMHEGTGFARSDHGQTQ